MVLFLREKKGNVMWQEVTIFFHSGLLRVIFAIKCIDLFSIWYCSFKLLFIQVPCLFFIVILIRFSIEDTNSIHCIFTKKSNVFSVFLYLPLKYSFPSGLWIRSRFCITATIVTIFLANSFLLGVRLFRLFHNTKPKIVKQLPCRMGR